MEEQPMPYPHVRNVYSPRQQNLGEVPVLLFDINDPVREYKRINKDRLTRARKIGPVILQIETKKVALFNLLIPHSERQRKWKEGLEGKEEGEEEEEEEGEEEGEEQFVAEVEVELEVAEDEGGMKMQVEAEEDSEG